jgi:hypothetical protein
MWWVVKPTPRPRYRRERPGTQCIRGRVGPRAGRKISPPPGFDPRTVQPVASRYIDCATPPLLLLLLLLVVVVVVVVVGLALLCRVFTIMYGVIHKYLRDVQPLRYSSRAGHAEGEHVNRGRDTASFCPTLQVLDSSFLLCVSWLMRSRFWNFRRDLRITLYFTQNMFLEYIMLQLACTYSLCCLLC